MDLCLYVNGCLELQEHPTIQIVDPQTVHVIWNFDKVLFGRRLPEAVSRALNFSTDSARFAAYDSISQEVSSSLVFKNTLGNYLPSPPQIIHFPMRIKKNQPVVRHFPYPTGIKYNNKHKQFATMFIVTLTVEQE